MEKRVYGECTPYEEYCDMPASERCELIDGKIVMMAAPSDEHQRICGELHGQLWLHLRGKRCQVRHEPGLQFSEDEPINNALRPDIAVVCDPSKFRKQGIVGAPDFIVEVLSPSDISHDTLTKLQLYMKEGVREYWIVNPMNRSVIIYKNDDGKYTAMSYIHTDHVMVSALDGFEIDLSAVFASATAE